jgi:3-hydroxy acid dehydrogenase / malonic semialdehyde reductase
MSIALITGATSGFGKAITQTLAQNNYDCIITGRRKERLEELEKELKKGGRKILSLCFDVRNRKTTNEAIESLPAEWKAIDVLINNAGLASGLSLLQDGDPEDWDKMIDTNVKGLLNVSRAVLPLMVKRNAGYVFNIGSVAGKYVYEKGNIYCATKFAVDAISQSMRIDLLKNNIRITQILPGLAETEFSLVRFKGDAARAKQTYQGLKALDANDIAELVRYCLSLPAHVCINELVVTPTAQANPFYLDKK